MTSEISIPPEISTAKVGSPSSRICPKSALKKSMFFIKTGLNFGLSISKSQYKFMNEERQCFWSFGNTSMYWRHVPTDLGQNILRVSYQKRGNFGQNRENLRKKSIFLKKMYFYTCTSQNEF